MDIPPPPPPPSPEDAPPPPPGPSLHKTAPEGPPPPPPAPGDPYGTGGSSYGGGLPVYPQQSYGQTFPGQAPPPPPYGGQYAQQPYGQPPYGQPPYGQAPYGQVPYGAPGPYSRRALSRRALRPRLPPPPQGWYAVERTTNGMAIASLVTSLTCVPLLGAILGIVGLRQIRRNGQRGRGLAIAGVTVSGVWVVCLAALIALGALADFDEGNTRVDDIRVGECFNTVGSSLADYDGGGKISTTVDVVSCDKEHDAEAFAIFSVDEEFSGGYPGVDRISDIAGSKCATYADDYLDDESLVPDLSIYYYMPPRAGWNHGDRGVTCFFGSQDGKVSGSVKSGGQGPGFGV